MDEQDLIKLEEMLSKGNCIIAVGRMNGSDVEYWWKTVEFPTDKIKTWLREISRTLIAKEVKNTVPTEER